MRHLLLIMILCPLTGYCQELVLGDSSIVQTLQPKMAAIYDVKDTALFFLTKKSFIDQKVFACNIVCYVKDNKPNRVIVNYTVGDGILSKEFWLENDHLIFCYLTMEYFDEPANKNRWKNFKNIASYESRYYFDREQIIFQKHTGLPIMPEKNNKLKKEKEKLLGYINQKYTPS